MTSLRKPALSVHRKAGSYLLNKKELTEADIRTKFITPAIVGASGEKWDVMTQLREEIYFTKGRVIVRGKTVKRGEAKKADDDVVDADFEEVKDDKKKSA